MADAQSTPRIARAVARAALSGHTDLGANLDDSLAPSTHSTANPERAHPPASEASTSAGIDGATAHAAHSPGPERTHPPPSEASACKLEAQASPLEVSDFGQIAAPEDDASPRYPRGPVAVSARCAQWDQERHARTKQLREKCLTADLSECTFAPSLHSSSAKRQLAHSQRHSNPTFRSAPTADSVAELTFSPSTNTHRKPPERIRQKARAWNNAVYAAAASSSLRSNPLQHRSASAHGSFDYGHNATSDSSGDVFEDTYEISRPGSSSSNGDGRASTGRIDDISSLHSSWSNFGESNGTQSISGRCMSSSKLTEFARRDADKELTFHPQTNVKRRPPERICAEAASYEMSVYENLLYRRSHNSRSLSSSNDSQQQQKQLSHQERHRKSSLNFWDVEGEGDVRENRSFDDWWMRPSSNGSTRSFLERQSDTIARHENKRKETAAEMYSHAHRPKLSKRSRELARSRRTSENNATTAAAGTNHSWERPMNSNGGASVDRRGRGRPPSRYGSHGDVNNSECTFKPSISRSARRLPARDPKQVAEGDGQRIERRKKQLAGEQPQHDTKEEGVRPAAAKKRRPKAKSSREARVRESLCEVGKTRKKYYEREREREEQEKRKEAEEMQECTFSPKTSALPSYMFKTLPGTRYERGEAIGSSQLPRHSGHGGSLGYLPNEKRRQTVLK